MVSIGVVISGCQSNPFMTVNPYTGEQQVNNGVLAELNTLAFENGEYWIRLVVVNDTGNYPERCAILYVIQN